MQEEVGVKGVMKEREQERTEINEKKRGRKGRERVKKNTWEEGQGKGGGREVGEKWRERKHWS